MKIVIFCGGVGTRMWPISRVKTPKQFEPLIDGRSTVQVFYDQVKQYVGIENIFIATNDKYKALLRQKLPEVPESNILLEPARRDLGPAVGYAASIMNKISPNEPLAIFWSDDLIKKPSQFYKALDVARKYLKNDPNKYLYIAQKPLFPDQNKGWIHFGKALKNDHTLMMYKYLDWHYRPSLSMAEKFFNDGNYAVNTGDFVTTPQHVMNLYKKYAPKMYDELQIIADSWGGNNHEQTLRKIYPDLEKISHDDLIATQTEPEDALVLMGDFGWFGFGDWDAIKQALQKSKEDVVMQGKVVDRNSKDCLIYNYTDRLVTTIDLENMLVVNTKDALLVCPKSSVPEIKKVLADFKGTALEKFT